MICDPSLTPSGLWPRAALRSTSVPCLCRDGKGGGGIHKCMAETQSRQMRAAARCTRHMHGTRMHGPLTRGSDIPHAPGSSALMQVRMHGSPPSSQSAGRSGRSCRPGDARARRGLWSRRRRPGRCRPDQRPCGGKRREMRRADQREGPTPMAAASTLSAIAPGGCLPSKEIIWLSVYRDLVQATGGGSDLRRREVRKERAPDLGEEDRCGASTDL